MEIVCPYCQHKVNPKRANPGKYTSKCPKCARQFAIIVPDDAAQPVTVRPLASEKKAGAAAPPKQDAKTDSASVPASNEPELPEGTVAYSSQAGQEANANVTMPIVSSAGTAPNAAAVSQSSAPGRAKSEATKVDEEDPAGGTIAVSADVTTPPRAAVTTPAAADVTAPPRSAVTTPDSADVTAPPRAAMTTPESADVTAPPSAAGAAASSPGSKKPAAAPGEMPKNLGGYQVVEELGRGGMGAVYLARQLSLDRNVALKVMNPKWARDAAFVARFVREAYAAAQLVHHNVVQTYDIGEDHGVHYFSMEFVKGQALQGLVKKEGKLNIEMAVGYILQAARGLKLAHDQGMIHRDIKPDNLMLSIHGVVKVADLGLVKIPDTPDEVSDEPAEHRPAERLTGPAHMTRVGVTMGTPSYMAPEQAKDASTVDARADVYSLGCTLYVLITGKLPFEGKSISEVLTKHATEPVVPPEVIVKRVPKDLSAILLKMMAKKPEERYASMDEVIVALEGFLGIRRSGSFSPSEEEATVLEECVKKFNGAPQAKLRTWAMLGAGGAAVLVTLFSIFFLPWKLTAGLIGVDLLAPVSYFVVSGFAGRGPLFTKFRQLVWNSSWSDWLTWAGGAALLLLVLWLVGLLWIWIGAAVVAALLGAGFYFLIDRKVAAERAGPLEQAEKLFRNMRIKGFEEDSIQHFVCKYAGTHWEEFYEAVFGYEQKLVERHWLRREGGAPREKFRAWREPIISRMNFIQLSHREARDRKHLRAIEQKSLQASGLDAAAARKKADQTATAMVKTGAEIRRDVAARAPSGGSAQRRSMQARLDEMIKKEEAASARMGRAALINSVLGVVLGPKVRFLFAAVLLGGCVTWLYQNLSPQLSELARHAVEEKEVGAISGLGATLKTETNPLSLPMLPAAIAAIFSSYNAGLAGLLLLVSAFFRGGKLGLFALPGIVVLVLGHNLGIPAIGPIAAPFVGMAAGTALTVVAFFFGRTKSVEPTVVLR